jgi:DNA-directed RNA polymerase subunit M/transcription elongation factor TFIIS
MDETHPITPVCRKCKRPMVFHSLQTVARKDSEETIQVYECKRCERLIAVSAIKRAA